MRKLAVLGICCAALVAPLGVSGTALAGTPVVDPDCDGSPYNNDFAVGGFDVANSSPFANDFTATTVGGVACGTTLDPTYFLGILTACNGSDTLNTNFDFRLPPGVDANPTAGIPPGSFVGTASGRVAVAAVAAQQCGISSGSTNITVEANDGDDDCPPEAVSCFRGSSSVGYGFVWVTGSQAGGFEMHVGAFHPVVPGVGSGGFTQFVVSLCRNAGATGTTSCGGGSAPWLMKNGNASNPPGCGDGNGLYQVRVQRQSGAWSPFASDCVDWKKVEPNCDGTPFDNDPRVNRFIASTPDSNGGGATSRLRFAGTVCGPALNGGNGGVSTITDHIDIMQAKGSLISPTLDSNVYRTGAYAGSLSGRIAYHDASGNPQIADTTAKLAVDPLSLHMLGLPFGIDDDCNREAEDGLAGENVGSDGTFHPGRPPSVIFGCFKVTSASGPAWNAWAWVTLSGQGHDENGTWVADYGSGRRFLTLGPIHLDGSSNAAGVTNIGALEICGYLGAVGGSSCGGTSAPVLSKNGDATAPNCGDGGEGIFEIIATNKQGQKTAGPQPVGGGGSAVTSCVEWTGGERGDTGTGPYTKKPPPKKPTGCLACTRARG